MEILIGILCLLVVVVIILVIFFRPKSGQGSETLLLKLTELQGGLKEDFRINREENNSNAKDSREELNATLRNFQSEMAQTLKNITDQSQKKP
ncbi:MAG: hypothetical protein WDM90_11235 [Ferruginibacter sp.]